MNYRHLFHAGNFADVMKHLTLVLVLDYLRQKEKPFVVLDAFAGTGLYDFAHPWAQRNPEYQHGIAKIFAAQQGWNDDIHMYANIVKSFNTGPNLQFYPGSPLIIAKMLRENDKALLNELHAQDFDVLAQNMNSYKGISGTNEDAYVYLRAHLPPKIKRGLVLIDPPYEDKGEFAKLASQMPHWKKRWASGIYMLWYPIKTGAAHEALIEAARTLQMPNSLNIQFYPPKENKGALIGSGLLVLNAPYTLETRLNKAFTCLQAQGFTHAIECLI